MASALILTFIFQYSKDLYFLIFILSWKAFQDEEEYRKEISGMEESQTFIEWNEIFALISS